MRFEKKIRSAFDKVEAPEAGKILPAGAFEPSEQPQTAKISARRIGYILVAAALTVCLIIGGVIGVTSRRTEAKNQGDGVVSKNTDGASNSEGTKTPDNKGGAAEDASYSDGVIRGDASHEDEFKHEDVAADYPEGVSAVGDKSGYAMVKDGYTISDRTDYEKPVESFEGEPDWIDYGDYNNAIRAGTLTASEWSDLKNLGEWLKRAADPEWASIISSRGFSTRNVVEVTLESGGASLFGTEVELESDGKVIWKSRSGIDGKAYLFFPAELDKSTATVRAAGVKKEIKLFAASEQYASVTLEIPPEGKSITQLDLMLMIDTTGSMSDELEYLKVELADMVDRIAKAGEQLSIRVSVNFYRDEGDEYVVKYFDFRSNINECIDQISKQRSDGGGDWPEAVHTALENAVSGHQWRENAVKLCFFVLDAPPHDESEIQGINENINSSLGKAAAEGIRIIPVASSGVDTGTEVILRSFAITTGGTYIYLTDDSGIGNSHTEASVSEKNVEPLNECMIRVVCEYCGLDYVAPEKRYAIKYDVNESVKSELISAPKSALPGETVEIRAGIIYDADMILYVNGSLIEKTEDGSGYWSYVFVMPDSPAVITARFAGKGGDGFGITVGEKSKDRIICTQADYKYTEGMRIYVALEDYYREKTGFNSEAYEVIAVLDPDGNTIKELIPKYDGSDGLWKASFLMPQCDVTLELLMCEVIYD